MNADTYQVLARRTLIDAPDHKPTKGEIMMIRAAIEMGIVAGKIADLVKKGICHQQGLDYVRLAELTDEVARRAYVFVSEATPAEPTDDQTYMLLWNTLGLLGEAAELAEAVTSVEVDADQVTKEAGDLTWYINADLSKLHLSFGDVLIGNIKKLNQRSPDGWNPDDSRVRADEAKGGDAKSESTRPENDG
jgi:NTP pyrophosphatase (non-canonical NTP hydrolase)